MSARRLRNCEGGGDKRCACRICCDFAQALQTLMLGWQEFSFVVGGGETPGSIALCVEESHLEQITADDTAISTKAAVPWLISQQSWGP